MIRVRYARRYRRRAFVVDHDTGLDRVLVSLSGLGFLLPLVHVLSPWLRFADYGLPGWTGWLGTAVFASALWLLSRSHADLGLNWSPRLELRGDHVLVTHGVFRRIRHPMYSAHWLWGVAQVLLIRNWIAGPSMLVFLLPLYLHRVPREEQMMIERFGETYRVYMSLTGRLVPGLWR